MSASGILQAATVISKTTQTALGLEIETENYGFLTLFADYVKGDETGLLILAYAHRTHNGTNHQYILWTETNGVYTAESESLKVTATGNYVRQYDLAGIDFIFFTQGGSNNDGTPTGTLAASYTLY